MLALAGCLPLVAELFILGHASAGNELGAERHEAGPDLDLGIHWRGVGRLPPAERLAAANRNQRFDYAQTLAGRWSRATGRDVPIMLLPSVRWQ